MPRRLTKEEWVEKAKSKFGDKYDYSKVEYINSKTKVCIICSTHGEFWQTANDHLQGYECPKCKNEYKPTTEEWIERAKKVHGEEYDYSKVEYIRAKTKVCIICPIHGKFWQSPLNHVFGKCKCPQCNSNKRSKKEEQIAQFLDEHDIKYVREKTFPWLKNKATLFLDFYLTDYNIAIEYQGEQHYRPIEKFGGEKEFSEIKERDEKKKELCNEHSIKILYLNRRNFCTDKILQFINETTN